MRGSASFERASRRRPACKHHAQRQHGQATAAIQGAHWDTGQSRKRRREELTRGRRQPRRSQPPLQQSSRRRARVPSRAAPQSLAEIAHGLGNREIRSGGVSLAQAHQPRLGRDGDVVRVVLGIRRGSHLDGTDSHGVHPTANEARASVGRALETVQPGDARQPTRREWLWQARRARLS